MEYWHWERVAAAAALAVYLLNMPIYLAVFARARGKPRVGVGFLPFAPRAAIRQARKRANAEKRRRKKRGAPVPNLFATREGIRDIVKRARVVFVSLWVSAGLGDGMRTALTCGYVNVAGEALRKATDGRVSARAYPVFDRMQLQGEAEILLCAKAWYWMIIAARYGAIESSGGKKYGQASD